MRRAALRMLLLPAALAACSQFPELDAAVDPGIYDRDFPALLPIDTLIASPARLVTPDLEGQVLSRVAALRARAARLGGPVVDAATKRRMARGVRP
ncbi:hypothetical protein [Pseudaestuariivita atlantica]|uniref:Lipoprotein n=1 Tax=Pseudaestuariivita atlantica TaxID=1317121 RepID=A0A0L1JLN3_9RHOB|nr:hypothetical protein [Pseudaestuariivita atlantica]KNG92660.1 hypothetical protein ATO11_16750 [Pseudaestuariivita atlantica]